MNLGLSLTNLPRNLSDKTISDIKHALSHSSQPIDKIIQNLPIEDLMHFLDCSMQDQNFLSRNNDLVKHLWTTVDSNFSQNKDQQHMILSTIFKNKKTLESGDYLPKNFTIRINQNKVIPVNRLLISLNSDYFSKEVRSPFSKNSLDLSDLDPKVAK